MSVEFKSKKAILSLISLINRYTGKESTNLTDAVNELKEKNETGSNKIKGLCNGTVEELTAEDLQGITKIIPYLFMNNTALKYVELPAEVTVSKEVQEAKAILPIYVTPSGISEILRLTQLVKALLPI